MDSLASGDVSHKQQLCLSACHSGSPFTENSNTSLQVTIAFLCEVNPELQKMESEVCVVYSDLQKMRSSFMLPLKSFNKSQITG
jgi:hypothetical protein